MKINFIKKLLKSVSGFSLLEAIVAISLFLVIILIVSDFFSLAQRSYNKGSKSSELVQNARVAIDRITRELRQSVEIVTSLPPTESDPDNPPASEIFFQNGHDISQVTYIKYYLDGTNLKRDIIAYYFESEPGVYVPYNSTDGEGDPPEETTLESRIVGEYFTGISFWGTNDNVYVYLNLEKNGETFSLRSCAYSRN